MKKSFVIVSIITLSFLSSVIAKAFSVNDYSQACSNQAKTSFDQVMAQANDQYNKVIQAADKIQTDGLSAASTMLASHQLSEEGYEAQLAKIEHDHDNTVSAAEDILSANRKTAFQNYQAQCSYAWDKYILGQATVTPTPVPLVETPMPTSTPPVSGGTPVPIITPGVSTAGPLVTPSCYPPEPALPPEPPAQKSSFSGCKDIVISPYGPFRITVGTSPGSGISFPGSGISLSLYPLTTDSYYVMQSKFGNGSFSFSSSDPSVASIENLYIKGLKPGSATITVKDTSKSDSCGSASVNVNVVPIQKTQDPKLVLNPSAISLAAGETKRLTAHYTMDIFDPATQANTRVQDMDVNYSVLWRTTDPAKVSVDGQGNIIEQGKGTAKIVAVYCGQTAETSVTVTSSAKQPVSPAPLAQVCADKAGIPNREKVLGVIDSDIVSWNRAQSGFGLGKADLATEPGKYTYIKFDYGPWDKKLTGIVKDMSASMYAQSCAGSYQSNWEQYCTIDSNGQPQIKSNLTPAQKMSCAMIGSCGVCNKTWQQMDAERKAECDKNQNNPDNPLNPLYYKKINDAWRAWASKGLTPYSLNFLSGWIDTVNANLYGFFTSGQVWLAYECLPSPSELSGAPLLTQSDLVIETGAWYGDVFRGPDFNKLTGSNNYFVRGLPISSMESELNVAIGLSNHNGIQNAKPGRYYLIFRADSGSAFFGGKLHTSVLSNVEMP